jgi:L-rhamnose mutarotase
MQRFCLALDLIDDAEMIREYEEYHKSGNAWPEVTQHDLDVGITSIQIYRTGNRLFMILEADDNFTFEKKAALESQNTGMGKSDVEISAAAALGQTRGEMGFNGKNIPVLRSGQLLVAFTCFPGKGGSS